MLSFKEHEGSNYSTYVQGFNNLRNTAVFLDNICNYFYLVQKISQSRRTVKTLNIGIPRLATVVVLNIKQFYFTMK